MLIYKKVIKDTKRLDLPLTLTYEQFHKLPQADKNYYVLVDGHFYTTLPSKGIKVKT